MWWNAEFCQPTLEILLVEGGVLKIRTDSEDMPLADIVQQMTRRR